MNILVTGANGFLGSAIVRRLLAYNHTVSALVRPDSNRENLEGLDIRIHTGDLGDTSSLQKALNGCDSLFHVAADYRLWAKDPQELYNNNVEGTRNIMRAALELDIQKVVYTSSVATLGVYDNGRISDEDTPVTLNDMVGDYKSSKFMAERVIDHLVQHHNLPAVIVNPSTPIGPRDIKPTPTGRIIRDAYQQKIPAFVDTGLNIVHVDDVAEGHYQALLSGKIGRRYILGGKDLSLKQILTCIAEYCGHKAPTLCIPRKMVYPIAWMSEAWASFNNGYQPLTTIDGLKMSKKKMFFSSERAMNELGYHYRPPEQAIHDAIDWFKAH